MDEREKLYDKFLESGNRDSSFFDEIDLIDIFDYATDHSDDGTRIKVISLAEKMYPESVELLERRALLFFDMDDYGEVSEILEKLPVNSFIGRLLKLKLQDRDKTKLANDLMSLIKSIEDFEDEWIIQLVDFAEERGLYDWLVKNKELITAKTSYPQTFLYEMVNLAIEHYDFENALKFAEELTEQEPFNGEFWEILSEIHTNLADNPYEADKAIDYALAINPDSLRALIQKSRIYSELDKPVAEIMPFLDRAISKDPDLAEPVIAKALYTASLGDIRSAKNLLLSFHKKHPSNLSIAEYLVKVTNGNIGTEIFASVFKKEDAPDESQIITLAITNYFDDGFNIASTIIKAYDRYVGLSYKIEPFEIYYRNGDYKEIVSLYERLNKNHNALISTIDLIYVLAQLRLGKIDGLKEQVNDLKKLLEIPEPIYISLNDQLERKSVYHYLDLISKSLDSDAPINFDLVDPFSEIKGKDWI